MNVRGGHGHIKRRVQRLLKWQWANDPAASDVQSAREKHLANFHDNLQRGDPRGAAADLSRLGEDALRTRGVYRILRAEPGGWVDLERAAIYTALSIAVNQRMNAFSGAYLAHVMVSGRNKLADATARAFEQDMKRNPDQWDQRYFARFVMHMRHRAGGQELQPELPGTGPHLGPFQSVVDAWTNASVLRGALPDVCTYHVVPAGWTRTTNEFDFYYGLIPVEIAFIRAMRAKEGLETPAIDHPLMTTPLARIPEGPQYDLGTDELWLRACDLLKQKMPELDLGP